MGRAGAAEPPKSAGEAEPEELAAKPKKETAAEAVAAAPTIEVSEEIHVAGRASDLLGIADSASEGVTGRQDLARRPIQRPGELLETVPGVIITQHSGGGKANQYFLRGFNLDHGTDFRVGVEGVPVNMPSHGHGQGYSDLSFLIPELVESVHYKKGPYYADVGDFSAAGSADMTLVDSLPKGLAHASGGSFGYRRLLAADSVAVSGGDLLGAVEAYRNDGPWDLEEDFDKLNALVRFSRGDRANGSSFTAMGYDGDWRSTDQIPRRAVTSGLLSRFGNIDGSDGGSSSRYSLSAEVRRGSDSSWTVAGAYALRYQLSLFSNFTYFLDDPENGDQFEQADRRTVAGGRVARHWAREWMGRETEISLGLEARADDVDNGLFRTRERERLSTTREDGIFQWSAGPFAEARVRWNPWLRTVLGLRADGLNARVDSDLDENSGNERDTIVSPKLSVLLGPFKQTELYLNFGDGFHSNDVRGATLRVDPVSGDPAERVDLLVRARGGDVGMRTRLVPNLEAAVTVFALELDSELVFVGDAGGTEAGRPSRRTGVEVQSFWRPLSGLSIDADFALSRGRFRDDDPAGDRIPGAIERAAAVGFSVDGVGPVFGSLRLRYFGPRDLIEDGSVRSRSSSLVNARLGYDFASGLRLALEAFNLLDEESSDIDYFYESRLPGEAGPVSDVHFHPHESRSVRLAAEWRF